MGGFKGGQDLYRIAACFDNIWNAILDKHRPCEPGFSLDQCLQGPTVATFHAGGGDNPSG